MKFSQMISLLKKILYENSTLRFAAGTYSYPVTNANGCTITTTRTLSGESPAGGSFSGPGVSAGMFDPMSASIGFNMISYTYTDVNGCTGSTVDSIYVDICLNTVVLNNNNNFSVFPNPNNGAFTLQLNTSTAADVMIYDALGQLVSKQKVQPHVQQQLNIATSGVYLIAVVTVDGKRTTQRVIVNR